MEIRKQDFFRLTENTIKKVKYIRLNKKASYLEKELENVAYNKGANDRSESIRFYAYGFYDSLTCVKPKEITSLAYQEHFLISYPFEKTANTSKVEQWFGILPLAEEKRCCVGIERGESEDVFFCREELRTDLPFIGVILISLGNMPNENLARDFKGLLTAYVETVTAILAKIGREISGRRYLAEVYYSLNCSDLCVAIRTDEIPLVHRINYEMKSEAVKSGYTINTTVIFAVQDIAEADKLKSLAEKNKSVSFIVRSNEKYDQRSKGVNGIGRYVTQFEYEEYIQFLPLLVRYKLLGEDDSSVQVEQFVKSICHEREWFIEESQSAYPATENALQKAVCVWAKDIHDELIGIEQLAMDIFLKSKELYGYKEIFTGETRLLKDLIYSYSDLWYQNASDSGFIFFAQLMIVLQGLKRYLDKIDMLDGDDDKLEKSIEQFIDVMHSAVCDLNGYNRQFQFLNQDSVNFPSYEIQSKVNAEKYMSAYNSFLHKFFALYYQKKRNDQYIVQNFPLALVDLSERKIIANLFFSGLYSSSTKAENQNVRAIFAVHFPSSEYFSNLWNSIPLLMHEASHTQNYGETIDRNNAVIYNIDIAMSTILANKMLNCVNNGAVIHTSAFLAEILKEKIYKAITSVRAEAFRGKAFGKWGLIELLDNCKEFYFSILGKHQNRKNVTYSQIGALRDVAQKDIERILQIFGFDIMCYVFIKDANCPSAVYYFLNVLYLEFNPAFYEKFSEEYDSFLKGLEKEVAGEGKEEIEQEMLKCALYRFLNYVKRDAVKASAYSGMMEANQSDSLTLSLNIIFIVGICIVYQKYSEKFSVKILKQDYCIELVYSLQLGNILEYTKKLEEAYERYGTQRKHVGGESLTHDMSLMRAMLYEYYELYSSVTNIAYFLKEKEMNLIDVCMEKNSDKFVERIRLELIEYIHEKEEGDSLHAIFTETNRALLVKLGFLEKDSRTIMEMYARVCAECNDSFVEDIIADRKQLFMEVYADCGMCCAMGFDPFGYCMFAMSIYKLVNDLGSMNPDSNFLADRMCSVVRMFFVDEEEMEWGKFLGKFLRKLCDVEMVESICTMLTSIKKTGEVNKVYGNLSAFRDEKFECGKDELEQMLKMRYDKTLTAWKDDIVGKLIDIIVGHYEKNIIDVIMGDKVAVAKTYLLRVYNVLQLFWQEEVLPHILVDNFNGFFQGVRKYIEENEGIKAVQADDCVKEIGRFYNMESPEDTANKFEWYYRTYCEGFLTQCNFIFDNYCDYRNAYDYLKSRLRMDDEGKVNLKINQWFEQIDAYYQREAK